MRLRPWLFLGLVCLICWPAETASPLKLKSVETDAGLAAAGIMPAGTAPRARMIEQYNYRRLDRPKLNAFAAELDNDPTAQGYIIAVAGRREGNEIQEHLDVAKDYLVSEREVDPSRIVTVEGGLHRHNTFELWLVPSGATPPSR
jgi:hypothetical protein